MKLVIHPAVEPERFEKIVAAAGPMRAVNAVQVAEAEREIVEADAFFGKITPPLLAAAGRLRWVQSPTASLEHYVFPELVDHPCLLTNMRGIFSDVIADQVLGYLLCFARNLHLYIRRQPTGRWEPVGGETARMSFAAGPGVINAIDRAHRQLAGAMLGIVGLGQIGAEIARRASAFGIRIVAVDPQPRQIPGVDVTCWNVDALPRLLAESDYVAIAAPHTPGTAKLFRRREFQSMKSTAYLINIGRGAIVDLADLMAALQANEIAGAALDVFETEPLPPDHPLWKMENVILTPHVAGFAPCISVRHLEVLLDNIRHFVRGEPLENVVNKAVWY